MYDVENPYKNVIGFLLPLPSLANYLIQNVIKGDSVQDSTPEEKPEPELPAQELPAQEEPLREWIKKMAGLK
jgi:hypothetical protein